MKEDMATGGFEVVKTRSERKKELPQPGHGPRMARGAYRGGRGGYHHGRGGHQKEQE